MTRSTDILVEIYGQFNGLMSYYARHKQLDMIKVNFTGIQYPKNRKALFDIHSLTNNRITVKILDLRLLVHDQQPYMSDITIYDLENGIKLGEIPNAFAIIDPIKIVDVRPKA